MTEGWVKDLECQEQGRDDQDRSDLNSPEQLKDIGPRTPILDPTKTDEIYKNSWKLTNLFVRLKLKIS